MAAKNVTAFLACMVPAAALAQSVPPPICHEGIPCVVDAKGAFVGIGSVAAGTGGITAAHVFNGTTYLVEVDYFGLIKGAQSPFVVYASRDCSGQPYLVDQNIIPHALPDANGTLYAAKRPFVNVNTLSYSQGFNRACTLITDGSNYSPVGEAFVLDSTVAKSWVPPFGVYEPLHVVSSR
jgi:hypothetical protein